MGDALQGIVKISGLFGIIDDKEVIVLFQRRMIKNRCRNKLRSTSQQVFQVDTLGLGKREPVRHLKKAGIIRKLVQQHFKIHRRQRYSRNGQFDGSPKMS